MTPIESGLVFHRGLLVRSTVAVRALQVLAVLFGVIYALFGVRLVLTYVGAAPQADLVQVVWQSTETLYAPFQWAFQAGDDGAGHRLEWSLLVAIASYAVVHALSRKLVLVLGRPRR